MRAKWQVKVNANIANKIKNNSKNRELVGWHASSMKNFPCICSIKFKQFGDCTEQMCKQLKPNQNICIKYFRLIVSN